MRQCGTQVLLPGAVHHQINHHLWGAEKNNGHIIN
jgi:hypothetical protein